MIPDIDEELKRALFTRIVEQETIWIGNVHELGAGRELVPFSFVSHNYLVLFSDPEYEAGDLALMLDMSQEWADGFQPEPNSRILKFFRADAVANFFKPESWKLSQPMQIFQFGETVADAIALHARACPAVTQYFYWPASSQLNVLYRRIFRHLNRSCLPGEFVHILEPTGVFDGYQRQ